MTQERSAFSEFEIRGNWWLPEKPKTRIAGVLRHRPGRMLYLELDTPFHIPWETDGSEVPTIQWVPVRRAAVLGEDLEGRRCTLLDTTELGRTFVSRCLLIGDHFNEEEDATFGSAEVSLTELEQWTSVSPLAAAFGAPLIPGYLLQSRDPSDPFTVDLGYQERSLLDVDIPSRGCRLEILSRADVTSGYDAITIRNAAHIVLRPTEPRTMIWYRTFFTDCLRLFSFFIGSPVARRAAILHTKRDTATSDPRSSVEFYDGQSGTNPEGRIVRGMPLPFRLVESKAGIVFENWFRCAERVRPAQQFIVETLPPNDGEVVTVLLRLTQGLEVLFRQFADDIGGGTYVTEEQYERSYYKPMFDALPKGTGQDRASQGLRGRLREYLRFGNEYSLKTKIERFIDWLPDPASQALNIKDPKKFAQTVANTRNWLTHHGEAREPLANSTTEVYQVNCKLRALTFGVLAKLLGLDPPAVQNCIQAMR